MTTKVVCARTIINKKIQYIALAEVFLGKVRLVVDAARCERNQLGARQSHQRARFDHRLFVRSFVRFIANRAKN
jgi:hypothetical protein